MKHLARKQALVGMAVIAGWNSESPLQSQMGMFESNRLVKPESPESGSTRFLHRHLYPFF
jgi:hypothetical protein